MKTIAAICMLIDHIGMVFFPWEITWRLIGRLAMPIFAYGIARGLVYTSSWKNYIKRLGIFAMISQIPFWLLRFAAGDDRLITLHLNIGFTFLTAALVIGIWQYSQIQAGMDRKKRLLLGLLCAALLLAADLTDMDYGSYGVLVVAGCYLVIKGQRKQILLYMIYTLLTLLYFGSAPGMFLLQEAGILGLVVCMMMKKVSECKLRKFFYIFYPVHMLAIAIIALWK